ncbi:putative 2OG-Fe(II) oxygenase [Alkalimonas sp. NCh-2]|uniref:putative 2OG-Fe(II) oxygenase n=1 Tax=Alkalimonas sp. NCh-2 TaxID=3144846 RepID=UPI0031F62285
MITEARLDSCWGVCQREGDYGAMHNHTSPQTQQKDLYSGMLYLELPVSLTANTFPDGCLHLVTGERVVYIPPIKGCIALWPAEYMHGIHPFRGEGDRLGIAFNVAAVNKEE